MKPRTRFQNSVLLLKKQLPPISEKQVKWAYEHCLGHYGKVMKKWTVCLDCGYTWKDCQPPLLTKLDGCICPQCGRKLTIDNTRKRVFKDSAYFGITTTYKQHQLFRLFFLESRVQYNKKPQYSCNEVVQRWIAKDGKNVTLSVPRAANLMYYDIWRWWEEMEIRQSSHIAYSILPYKTYPAVKYLAEIKRNGFRGNFYGLNPFHFFSLILENNLAETLLKCGEIEWFKFTYNNPRAVSKCWAAIKIALRHKYEIKDKHLWIDYIELLLYFNKDIRNPKIIFPEKLHDEHDRLVRKKRQLQEMQKLAKKKEEAIKNEEPYKRSKGKYLGIEFSDGQIQIGVLQSVQDFIEEGDIMQHCVFTNEYFAKQDSLILSARMDARRLETIEVSLRNYSVVQSRGKRNVNTEFHERIVKLVESNMNLIKKYSRAN